MTKALFLRYKHHENEGTARLHQHPFFRHFRTLSEDQLKNYLLQRMFSSREFAGWYNEAVSRRLHDAGAREVIRTILRDEIPRDAPTHLEDLVADLQQIGIPMERIRSIGPSSATRKTMERLFGLLNSNSDLATLVSLRMAGELMVSAEYGYVVAALEQRFGLRPEQSRFYYPHYRHDSEGGDHPDAFTAVLEQLIQTPADLEMALRAVDAAVEARLSFFDQFVGGGIRRRSGSIAFAAAVAVLRFSPIHASSQPHATIFFGVHSLRNAMPGWFNATGKPET